VFLIFGSRLEIRPAHPFSNGYHCVNQTWNVARIGAGSKQMTWNGENPNFKFENRGAKKNGDE
jgi:hypothetical protein